VTLKESQGHSESDTALVIECHKGTLFGNYDSTDTQSPTAIVIECHQVTLGEVKIPGSIKRRKKRLLRKREKKTTLFRRQEPKSEKIKCLALHYYSNLGQCISSEILMTNVSGRWKEHNRKMEEYNQQSELERGEESRRSEITKKLEAIIQQLRTRAIFGRIFLTRLV
jgi:hypothetical protein